MSKKEKDSGLSFFGIPKVLPFLAKYKKELILNALCVLFMTGMDVLRPMLQRYAIDHFVGENTLDTMGVFVVFYLVVVIITALVNYVSVKILMKCELSLDRDMRNRAFAHLQELSFDYFNTNSVGYIHARVMSDTERIGEFFTWELSDGIGFLLYIAGAITVMLSNNARLTGTILLIVPAICIFYGLFQGRMFRLHREVREINSRITGNFNEGITGAKTIKSLVAEEKIGSDFQAETRRMKLKSAESSKTHAAFGAVTHLASSTALAIVLWKDGILAADDVGTFSMFMSYAQGLMEPVRWLVEVLGLFVQGKVNIERYSNLIERVPSVTDSDEVIEKYGDQFDPKTENWESIRGDIEFRNVDFKYPDGDEYILENFSLKIPFGTNVAIVGETGAGKSTLANLICRFYEPTSGSVLIDGVDARERSQLWLHSALGYVLQAPHLFSGTIRQNLVVASKGATEEEISEAIRLVSADSVIAKLDKGLDSDVGEGGDMLSTGEKQLICFARAILAKPKIIVLDEATASVDTVTEQRIQAAIDEVIKGRTSIVIAHRLSTVLNADIILVVPDGKIVESGKHDELLEKKGYYYRLWKRQYEEDVSAAAFSRAAGTRS